MEGERGWGGANLRTQFGKIVRQAGVVPWPRLWHSLRALCGSDLARSFSLVMVTKWPGDTPSVSPRHHVDPTEATFDRAVTWVPTERGALGARNEAPQARAGSGSEPHIEYETAGNCAFF